MSAAAQNAPVQPWTGHEEVDLTTESLHALFDNEIPAIRVRGFASRDECRGFKDAIAVVGMQHAYNFADASEKKLSDFESGYIGLTHYNYRHKPKSVYLAEVPEAIAYRDRVQSRAFDALERMIETLAALVPGSVSIAQESDGHPLYAGIIRNATGGAALHADFAPFTASGLVVGQIDAQISWNLWVEHPSDGGQTTVHHQPWTPDVSQPGVPEQYPLDAATVAGAEKHTYYPAVGDAIIFNTRNPHQIAPAGNDDQPRLQIGSFIGRMPNRDLILWS